MPNKMTLTTIEINKFWCIRKIFFFKTAFQSLIVVDTYFFKQPLKKVRHSQTNTFRVEKVIENQKRLLGILWNLCMHS